MSKKQFSNKYNLPAFNDKIVTTGTLDYWKTILDLLSIAAKYDDVAKLSEGLSGNERWKYEIAYQKRFNSNLNSLNKKLFGYRKEFKGIVDSLNFLYRKKHLRYIPDSLDFLELFRNQGRRDFYRREVKKKVPKNLVVSLMEIEDEWQKRSSK